MCLRHPYPYRIWMAKAQPLDLSETANSVASAASTQAMPHREAKPAIVEGYTVSLSRREYNILNTVLTNDKDQTSHINKKRIL